MGRWADPVGDDMIFSPLHLRSSLCTELVSAVRSSIPPSICRFPSIPPVHSTPEISSAPRDARFSTSIGEMYGLSAADGFLDVNQGLEDMIKYLANEPSAGLFYVQQHARNAMPSVLDLEDKIMEKSHSTMLQTEDLEDSICCLRSMSECGFHIVDEMVKDINKSLHLMSTSQPQKGLLRSSSQSFQTGKDNLHPFSSFGELSGRGSYLSSVFSSVKQKATILKWSQVDSLLANDVTSRVLEIERDDLPLSSQITVEQAAAAESTSDFEKFKSEQEAKLKEWLDDA